MKIKHLFASTLSLALVACQVAAPLNAPVSTVKTSVSQPQTLQALNIAKPALPQIDTTATVTQSGDTEQVKVQIKLPTGFRTQLANRQQLAFIKVNLKGQGISGTLTHEGAEFLPVTGDTITASIDDVPLSNGNLRVVMVQGYDSNLQPLGAFEARGYYRSTTGTNTLTITLRRSMILLGRILESALGNSALINALDIPALQAVLEDAMGYDSVTGEFVLDPSELDADEILALIPSTGSPLPTANDITTHAMATTQDVVFDIETPNGRDTNEVVRLVLNDPNSGAKILPSRTASGTEVIFINVVVGNWTLSAYDSDGNLLASTPVTIDENTATVTDNPLMLSDVLEFVPIGEFRVNTYTTNSQRDPVIAVDHDGDFVIAWNGVGSQDSDNYGIYAQRYNSVGVAQGSEFLVNTHTTNRQSVPSIAMDSDGDFAIAWHSQDQDGSDDGVYAQRFNRAGVAQGSEFRVATFTTDDQEFANIAMDADGDFVITWQSENQDGDFRGIYAQRYNSAGAVQGSEFRVNSYTSGGQSFPKIAMDDDGDFVVSWTSISQDGNANGVYAQRYNSAGTAQGSEFRVNSYTANNQMDSEPAMDADGDFVITWRSFTQDGNDSGIYAQRYNSAGAAQGSEFRVNTVTTSIQTFSSIAMDQDGDFIITWDSAYQDGGLFGVYGQRYNSAGTAQGSEFLINTHTTDNQQFSSVAIDRNGHFAVAWTSTAQDGSSAGNYAKRYNSAGEEQ